MIQFSHDIFKRSVSISIYWIKCSKGGNYDPFTYTWVDLGHVLSLMGQKDRTICLKENRSNGSNRLKVAQSNLYKKNQNFQISIQVQPNLI